MMTAVKSPVDIQNDIVTEFQSLTDWDARYKHIIGLGKQLPDFPEEHRTEQNQVKGCQSTVWMHAFLEGDAVVVQADSDAMIVRGLIALLLRVYAHQPPDVILATEPEFFHRLGMGDHISMQRSNGLFAMIKQIKLYAMVLKMQAQ
ncbi:MAG: SufE family protein [Vampirovibrio sp.]|nr:SufE family protein [Vampirovibrio sp.]